MHAASGEQHYLDKARLLSDWHWQARGPETGLVPDSPYGVGLWNGEHSFTEVTGCYATQLLRCYELTGDPVFRDRATSLIKAYEKYGGGSEAPTMQDYIKRICEAAGDHPVSLEVIGPSEEDMTAQGRFLFETFNPVAGNVVVKIPVCPNLEQGGEGRRGFFKQF